MSQNLMIQMQLWGKKGLSGGKGKTEIIARISKNLQQKSEKLNRLSTASNSRRQQKSYLQRHKGKNKKGEKSSTTFYTKNQGQESSASLIFPNQNVIQLFPVATDFSSIKIEEQFDEYQKMIQQFSQTQKMWSQQMDKTKNEINSMRQNIKNEQKYIYDKQRQLTNKRIKLSGLEEKAKKSNEILKAIKIDNYQQIIWSLQNEYDQIKEMGQKQIEEAKNQKCQLLRQNEKINLQLKQLYKQIENLRPYESKNYSQQIASVFHEQELMKAQIGQMQRQIEEIISYLRERQKQMPIRQEVHRKYLELYQKMFIMKELDKMTHLVALKDQQISRIEDYKKKKAVFREKRKQIQKIQLRGIQKKNTISRLSEVIRDKSTQLLQLYQMDF